jgi:hypothetical protein
MITVNKIEEMIADAQINMKKSQDMLGKEIFQKRLKPIFEGYITALCTVLELNEEDTTNKIKGNK